MKIGILQVDLTVGDFSGNSLKIQQAYERVVKAGAELVLAPELGLCGYPPRDLLNREDFIQAHDRSLRPLAAKIGSVPLLMGGIEKFKGKDGRPLHNAAFLLHQKKARVVARKALLPTYDVFDEDRYFEPGGDSQPIRLGKIRVGVTICEDIWNDEDVWPVRRYRRDPVRELAKKGIDLLVNLSASPWSISKGTGPVLAANCLKLRSWAWTKSSRFSKSLGGYPQRPSSGAKTSSAPAFTTRS